MWQMNSNTMWILTIPGWEESKGVRGEVEYNKSYGKPIHFVNQQGDIHIPENLPSWCA